MECATAPVFLRLRQRRQTIYCKHLFVHHTLLLPFASGLKKTALYYRKKITLNFYDVYKTLMFFAWFPQQKVHSDKLTRATSELQKRLQCRVQRVPGPPRTDREHHPTVHYTRLRAQTTPARHRQV